MMKKLLRVVLFGLILLSKPALCQDTLYVPDANFRAALLEAKNQSGVSYNITAYQTRQVIVPDPDVVTYLNLNRRNISDVTGLEGFTKLEILYCSNNSLTELDVSKNYLLYNLRCSENNLRQLDLSANDSLEILFCNQNQLQSINVTQNAKLKWLVAYSNNLSWIDISQNANLKYFYCYKNNISDLDLSQNSALQWLICNNNQITSLDLSANKDLKFLYCHENLLQQLDLSLNTHIEKLKCYYNPLHLVMLPENYYLTLLEKDETTIIAEQQDTSENPTFPIATTGVFELGETGAIVNISSNSHSGAGIGSLEAKTGTNPFTIGSLPAEIGYVHSFKYWTITSTLDSITYDLVLDLSDFFILDNFNNLFVLKRESAESAWVNVTDIPNVSLQHNEPYMVIRGLESFSDFAIASSIEIPLPVEISTFKGTQRSDGFELSWRVLSETNNAGFILTRDSVQIATYATTPALEGRGTSGSIKTYTYRDKTVSPDSVYCYRLRSIDFSGASHEYPGKVVMRYDYNNETPGMIYYYALEQNYPNPFNPTTTIQYNIRESSTVKMDLFDIMGRKVETVFDAYQNKGQHSITIDGSKLSSGIYFYRLSTPNYQKSRQMILMK
jgi:hypothetical protein